MIWWYWDCEVLLQLYGFSMKYYFILKLLHEMICLHGNDMFMVKDHVLLDLQVWMVCELVLLGFKIWWQCNAKDV